MEVLQQFILALVLAVVVVVVLSRFKISPIIGFLLTGIVIGPNALSLVSAGHEIEVMAEIGVMLLMFTIGLEFSIKRILSMKHQVLVLGGLQIIISISVVFVLMRYAIGFSTPESLIGSFVISMSSTAIVLKSLQEKGQLQSPSGRIMTGILLFQDICVVPLIILTPLVGTFNEVETTDILLKVLLSFVFIVVIFFVSKFLLPKLFDFICSFRIKELFMMLVLVLCFGLAMLTNYMGFSLALGSFIAGMILAESDFIYQIEADIMPLKNIFLSIFFISVGMLLNIDFIVGNAANVSIAAISIMAIKTLVVAGIAIAFSNPVNISIAVGLGISQIGEFSFMLLNLAKPFDFISDDYYQVFLSSSIISMMATPAFLSIGNILLNRSELKKNIATDDTILKPVIMAGFGINGQNLSRIFRALNIGYKIIEINPNTVKKYKKLGEDIVFGDITKKDNLIHLGVDKAQMMIIAITDWEATQKAVSLGKQINPDLEVIVRTEFVTQIEPLYKAGANVVISQEFEASLEIAGYVLRSLGVAAPVVRIKSQQLRKRHYGFFSGMSAGTQSKISELVELKKINEAYVVLGESTLVDTTIKDIKAPFPEEEIKIIGIIRGNETFANPTPDFRIQKFDMIILYGLQEKIDDMTEFLDNFKPRS